jgi:hypothetical protein
MASKRGGVGRGRLKDRKKHSTLKRKSLSRPRAGKITGKRGSRKGGHRSRSRH